MRTVPARPVCRYYLSLGWLRIDLTFEPLRSNPRFRKLLEGTA
jgi:hypothetical protein